MDKNTIYGLILMALVFLGFMWLQPKPETVDAGRETTTAESATRPNATGYDALSATETDWLRKNLAANGDVKTLDDGRRVYTHTDATFALTLDGDSIYGTVRDAAGAEHSYASLFGPDHAGLSEAAQRELVEKLRSMSTSMGRFGKFTRFLSGDNREITLDNDVLALTINTRSGSITKAELKKYDSEYSADESKKVRNTVVIFNDSTNTFNFTLPLAQAIETKDLYFTPRQVNDSTLVMALEFAPDTYWGIEYTLPRGDNYVIGMRIVQHNMDKVVETNNRILTFDWHQQINRQEQGRMFEERNSGIFYKFAGG